MLIIRKLQIEAELMIDMGSRKKMFFFNGRTIKTGEGNASAIKRRKKSNFFPTAFKLVGGGWLRP